MKNKDKKFLHKILWGIVGLSALALTISIYLYCKHQGICQSSFACVLGADGVDGCQVLGESDYSRIFGVPIAWFGVLYYTLLFSLSVWVVSGLFWLKKLAEEKALQLLTVLMVIIEIGIVLDIILAAINFFVLPVICLLCIYTYVCQLFLLLFMIILYKRFAKKMKINVALCTVWWPALLVSIAFAIFVAFIWLPADKSVAKTIEKKNDTIDLIEKQEVDQYIRELNAFLPVNFSTKNLKTALSQKNDGKKNQAKVQIVDFSDFLCSYCYRFTFVVDFLRERWPGRIQNINRFFPLDGQCNGQVQRKGDGASCYGAMTAYCVAENYPQKYDEYFAKLFALQRQRLRISKPVVRTLLTNLKIDFEKVDVCTASDFANKLLRRDLIDAKKIGVTGTPTIVLNNRLMTSGVPDIRWLIAVVDALVIKQEGQAAIDDFYARHSLQPQ